MHNVLSVAVSHFQAVAVSRIVRHSTQSSGAMITGIRSWIALTSSFELVVMIANVRSHSSVSGRFQFSQMPARANGSPLFMPMA